MNKAMRNLTVAGCVLGIALIAAAGVAAGGQGFVTDVSFLPPDKADTLPADTNAAVSLIADREEYDLMDVTGVALARVRAPAQDLAGLRLEIKLQTDERARAVEKAAVSPLEGSRVSMTLGLRDLAPGKYSLVASLLDQKGKIIAEDKWRLWKTKRRWPQNTPAEKASVPLTVWASPQDCPEGWPVSTGVPFPQNVLWSSNSVRLLDAQGAEVPCQTSVRSTWNPHGSIRWLGLDFQPKLETNPAVYTLEFGSRVTPKPAPNQLVVSDAADSIRVNTGLLQFTVWKKKFNLVDEVTLNDRRLVGQGDKGGLELADTAGNVYRASNDRQASVAIEETGPLKTVIRAEGWYVRDDTDGSNWSPGLPTDKLCKHVTRITAYAGKPYVAVQHVLVITFDSNKAALRNVALSLALPGMKKVFYGLDGKTMGYDVPEKESLRLLQRSWNRAEIETEILHYKAAYAGDVGTMEKMLAKGAKADGWFRAAGESGGVAVFVRDIWQMYPKELEVRDGRMWIHVWPRHGKINTEIPIYDPSEIYHLWWVHQGKTLDFRAPGDVIQALWQYDGKGAYPAYVLNCGMANAMGVALEHNMLMLFQGPAAGAEAEARQAAGAARLNAIYQLEPHAFAPPEWVCASRGLGYLRPLDRAKYPGVANYCEYEIKARLAAMDYARDYGMFNYQDVHGDNSWFRNGTWSLNRIWNAGHHGSSRLGWILYAASGDPEYLALARRNARHVMNVDVIHFAPENCKLMEGEANHIWSREHKPGAMYHCKGVVHWGSDNNVFGHVVNYDFAMWDFFLTGNLRSREVALEWCGGIKAASPPGCGTREGIQTLNELTELYQATWDPGLLELVNRFARAIESQPLAEQGWVSYAPFLSKYLCFSGDQAMRDRAIEWKHTDKNYNNDMNVLMRNTALYYDSGDKKWLMEPEIETVRKFFAGLPKDPKPVPQIDDKTLINCWYVASYPIQYMLPFLSALDDAGVDLAGPGK